MCRAETKLYLRAVSPEFTSIHQNKAVDADASSIGIDIHSAIEASNVHLSSVRMES